MGRKKIASKFELRNELISKARYGEITPQEAEAEARAAGLEPFERQPELPAFDPLRESRWTIVMAIAWIAWRDIGRVRENCPGFRSECIHWIFREWNQPVENGTAFAPRAGWFPETWHEATTARLSILENILKGRDELPPTWQMTVQEAEETLWRALLEEHLVAEAVNADGRPVDIPAREWSYLKLFEEGKRDTLKYDALDPHEPFRDVKLRRDDLMTLWPVKTNVAPEPELSNRAITPDMLAPLAAAGSAGYVPLGVALHWIMTKAGTRSATVNDAGGWNTAVDSLWPLICSGEIELIGLGPGRGLSERIPPQTLSLIRVLPPLAQDNIQFLVLNGPSHINCAVYCGEHHWRDDFNDRLYVSGRPGPLWTHLQVKKADILSRWPKPSPAIKTEAECCRWLIDEMRQSPTVRPKPKAQFWKTARTRFKAIGLRQFERAWDKALDETGAANWAKAGRPARQQSNHRSK